MISSRLVSCAPLLRGLLALAFIGCGSDVTPLPDDGNAAGKSGAPANTAGASAVGGAGAGAGGSASPGGTLSGGAGTTSGTGGAGGTGLGGDAGSAGLSPAGSSTGGAGNGPGGSGGTASDPKIVLFDGQDLSKWQAREGGADAPWTINDGALTVVPGTGDLHTRDSFGDIELHVEFMVPSTPTTNGEQDRGNSGIYLMGRYEVQVLDSYMHALQGMNDCGAIYELKDADVNAALAAETWQTYEITFRAPRYTGQNKTENARVSVIWNGQIAQDDVEVPAPTRLGDAEAPGDAPLRLQDHGNGVRFRNIWLKKL